MPIPYGSPRLGLRLDECQFYHTMTIPGVGEVKGFEGGNWDLQPVFDAFLGGIDFRGKRVLEIGPASGCLTFEMERRGASVVCAEIPADHAYDVVPYPEIIEKWQNAVDHTWGLLTNSWWFAHEHFKSSAQVIYIGAYDLDKFDIGRFDIAILSNMLLHNRDPLKIMRNCANITDGAVVVVDIVDSELENHEQPLMRFVPEPAPNLGDENWNQWWRLSTRFTANALSVLGFRNTEVTKFSPTWNSIPIESYRVVARR